MQTLSPAKPPTRKYSEQIIRKKALDSLEARLEEEEKRRSEGMKEQAREESQKRADEP